MNKERNGKSTMFEPSVEELKNWERELRKTAKCIKGFPIKANNPDILILLGILIDWKVLSARKLNKIIRKRKKAKYNR